MAKTCLKANPPLFIRPEDFFTVLYTVTEKLPTLGGELIVDTTDSMYLQ